MDSLDSTDSGYRIAFAEARAQTNLPSNPPTRIQEQLTRYSGQLLQGSA